MPSIMRSAAGLLAAASTAFAHGHVTGIIADGVYSEGFQLADAYVTDPAPRVGWTEAALDNGYIAPDAYTTSDIICHKSATNALLSADVTAGSNVTVEWDTWPTSHHGPVINYMANCGDDCTTVDKTTLLWFKISESGLLSDGTTEPGTWATDSLIANNFSASVTIPSTIAAGNYVLRHEIIALHSASSTDGAQNYPQCLNLVVSSDGTDAPTGVLGTALYTETDPGILFNLYTTPLTYTIPGPALYVSGDSSSDTSTASSAAVVVASSTAAAVVASSTAAAVVVASSPAAAVASSAPTTMVTSVVASATPVASAAAVEADDTCEE